MSADPKPRFRIVAGRPVEQYRLQERETPIEVARRRYGKPFAFEPGAKFEWKSGPTVLAAWLMKRRLGK